MRALHVPVGPNDGDYVTGFRSDWEREQRVRFRWTGLQASVRLPFRVRGDGARLRLRVRRHLVEPAFVSVRVEGRLVHRFEIAGGGRQAYQLEEIPLGGLRGDHPFTVDLQFATESARPLGAAVDWIELAPESSQVMPLTSTRHQLLATTLIALAVPAAAGARLWVAVMHAALMLAAAAVGFTTDPVAAERTLRLGLPIYALVGALSLAIVRLRPTRRALRLEVDQAGTLSVIVLLAVTVRAAMLLHPSYFYPDVRVHARFAHLLARQGPSEFFAGYIDNQFRFSLGLQDEGGHWYAFPYPPGFYVLAAPLIDPGDYSPETAVSLAAGAVNALGALVVFGLARRFGGGPPLALLAAGFVTLLPLFGVRLSLAYFPALVGHTTDALVLLFLSARIQDLDRPRWIAALAALLALAMLMYTQALVNFGLLLGLISLSMLLRRPDAPALRRVAGMTVAGILGLGIATVGFYGRYVPSIVAMSEGKPVRGEQILRDRVEREQRVGGPVEPEALDRFAADDISVVRGLHKGAARMWIFYSGWSFVIAAGAVAWLLGLAGPRRQLALAWLASFPLLNLASGGLPNPNLLRYTKDLEFVAPAVCIAMATFAAITWKRGDPASRFVACAVALGFLGYGAMRWCEAFVLRFAPVL